MKTRVILTAEITIEVEEDWENRTSINQVQADATRAAQARKTAIEASLREKGFYIGPLKYVRTILDGDSK